MPSLFSRTDSELASLLLLLFPHRLFWFLRARYTPIDSQSIRCNTVHGAEAKASALQIICNRAAVCRSLSLKMAYYWVIIKSRTPSASQPSEFSLYNSLLLVKNPSMCGWAYSQVQTFRPWEGHLPVMRHYWRLRRSPRWNAFLHLSTPSISHIPHANRPGTATVHRWALKRPIAPGALGDVLARDVRLVNRSFRLVFVNEAVTLICVCKCSVCIECLEELQLGNAYIFILTQCFDQMPNAKTF